MSFAGVYPLLYKRRRKGTPKRRGNAVFLADGDNKQTLQQKTTKEYLKTFSPSAATYPKVENEGVICGYRFEEIETLMQKFVFWISWLMNQRKDMDKILRT